MENSALHKGRAQTPEVVKPVCEYSALHPNRGHIAAKIVSEALPEGRITCLRPNPDGAGMGVCEICDKPLRYNPPPSSERVLEVACMGECEKAAFPVRARYQRPVTVVEDEEEIPAKPTVHVVKRGNCEKCGGPPSVGRGWQHQEVDGKPCPLSLEGKQAAKAAEVKARVEARPPCHVCGGPAAKTRGWQHREVNGGLCPESGEAKMLAKQAEKKQQSTGVRQKRKPRGL